MRPDTVQSLLVWFIPTLLSLTVHEWAHAASAYTLGDDTAQREGRMTLNPVPHIDPLGTLLVPVLQVLFSGSVLFAWAKPVPVMPVRFTRKLSMSTGSVLVSAAGPISNLLLALGAAIGIGIYLRLGQDPFGPGLAFLRALFIVNLGLAIFNLLPIPPLDGATVLHGLLPRRSALAYERIFPYAPVLLLGVLFFGGRLIAGPRNFLFDLLMRVTSAIAG